MAAPILQNRQMKCQQADLQTRQWAALPTCPSFIIHLPPETFFLLPLPPSLEKLNTLPLTQPSHQCVCISPNFNKKNLTWVDICWVAISANQQLLPLAQQQLLSILIVVGVRRNCYILACQETPELRCSSVLRICDKQISAQAVYVWLTLKIIILS